MTDPYSVPLVVAVTGHRDLVPGEQRVYVAPELVLHYMNAHGYQPPEEFCTAVMRCPRMGTPEYRQALLTAGGPGILRYASGAE